MKVQELNEDERKVLLWLLAYMADADGVVAGAEIAGLEEITSALGIHLYTALTDARGAFADRDEALRYAGTVVRAEARGTIRAVLAELAGRDGAESPEEQQMLAELDALWST